MAEGADDDRPLGKVKRMDGCLKVYKKMPCSGKKEWCALGNFDLQCSHKVSSPCDKGPAQYVFKATVLPEDATTKGPFYIVVSKEDFDGNDKIIAKIQSSRPGSGGYIKEGIAKHAWLASFFNQEISKMEEDIAERNTQHQSQERQPAVVYKYGGYEYFTFGGERQILYVVGRNCTIPLTTQANCALALYNGNLNPENFKEYVLPDWTVSSCSQFDGQGFIDKLKTAFRQSFWPIVVLFGNTLLSVQKEALYTHDTVKALKVGAVHLVGPSSAHKSTLFNHFRWTLPQEGNGPVRIDKMSVASLKVETGRWCRFPVGQDPCEDQTGKLSELLLLLDRIYEGSNEMSFKDLGKDRKSSIPSNIHLVWQGEMSDLSHLDISRLSKDLFLFMEELDECEDDIDELLDSLKEDYSKEASSLFKNYVIPLNVPELWNKVKDTKKCFTEHLSKDIGERLVRKYSRLVEGYALNYEASLEFLRRAKIVVDSDGLKAYFLDICIPTVLKKICTALNKEMPCSSELTHEYLSKLIYDVGDETILQHITFVTSSDKLNQRLAFSSRTYRDYRLKKLFPSAQPNNRCRFVSPSNPKGKVWFMRRQNVDLYGTKSCQGKGYVVTEDDCPDSIKQALVFCLKGRIPDMEECSNFREMRLYLDNYLLELNEKNATGLDETIFSKEFAAAKAHFIALSGEEQNAFMEWASTRDINSDTMIGDNVDEEELVGCTSQLNDDTIGDNVDEDELAGGTSQLNDDGDTS